MIIPSSYAATGDIVDTDVFGLKISVEGVEYDVSDILTFVQYEDGIYYLEPIDHDNHYHVLTYLNYVHLHDLLEDKIDDIDYGYNTTPLSIKIELDTNYPVNYHFYFGGAQSVNYQELGFNGFIDRVDEVMMNPYSIDFSGIYLDTVEDSQVWLMDIDLKSDNALLGTYTEPSGSSPFITLGIEIIEMSITYNVDEVAYVTDDTITYATLATPPVIPTKEGYTFIGWYTEDDQLFNFSSNLITEDIVLDAKWVEDTIDVHTVTFFTNGGTDIDNQLVPDDTALVEPMDPSRTGYSFGGWHTDASLLTLYDLETLVTGDLTLYAKWVESTSVPTPTPTNNTLVITLAAAAGVLGLSVIYLLFKKK
jgi:uncharacterized repeat protein (TIGR02543 family)